MTDYKDNNYIFENIFSRIKYILDQKWKSWRNNRKIVKTTLSQVILQLYCISNLQDTKYKICKASSSLHNK